MFKQLLIDDVKKAELTFDINSEPPSLEEMKNRINSFPDIKMLEKKDYNTDFKCGLSAYIISWIIFTIVCYFEFSAPIENLWKVAIISLFPSTITFLIYMVNKESNIYEKTISYVNSELNNFEELEPSNYAEMIEFCKKSKSCSEYKDKIIQQGRNFVNKEYYVFKEYVEKVDKYNMDKELLFSLGDLNGKKIILEKEQIEKVKEGYVI